MKMLLLALLLVAQRPISPALQVGNVTGRLLNEDGTPAAKIRVSAMAIPQSPNESPTLMTLAETDSTGRYRLTDVPVGRYYIVAGFVDFPTYYPRGTGPTGATPVNVTANATVANIDFRIEKPSTGVIVSGRVMMDSSPSFGAVQVMLNGGNNNGYVNLNLPAKLDGSFEFVRVRPGTYSLTVNPSPVPESKTVIVGDKDVTGLELRVPWITEVTGRVAVEGGGPSPILSMSFSGGNRVVNAYHQGANQPFRAILPEGFYAFTIANLPSGYFLKSVTSGGIDLLSTPLGVRRTELPAELIVTLGVSAPPPWVKISGRITGSLQGTTGITLNGPTGNVTSNIAADGTFELAKILPGNYNVSFTPGNATVANQGLTLVIPNKDISGVELPLPAVKEVSGRVVVEDGGPLPRAMLMLTPAIEEPGRGSTSTPPSLAELLVTRPNNRGAMSVYLPLQEDGTFKISLPEGRSPVTATIQTNGSTPPYVVKSFTYGSTDLTKEPLALSTTDSAEMRLTFAAATATSWARVTGRVLGLPARSPTQSSGATVSLRSNALMTALTAPVRPDGSFEFSRVYSGNYQAQLNAAIPNIGIPPVEVTVASTDVTGVQIVVPAQKEISGRIILEGRGTLPRLGFPLTVTSGTSGVPGGQTNYININPQPDGTFKVLVPEGERQVGRPNALPPGYTLKSVQYGSTDLAGVPLRVTAADTAELRFTITTPDLPPVKVSGKVSGIDPAAFSRGPVSINLNEPRYVTPLQATVSPDGSFEFPAVFSGSYNVGISTGGFNIPPVNVGSRDVTGLEITVPRQKEIVGRVVLEGSGPMPRFTVTMNSMVSGPASGGNFVSMGINPQSDGTFRVTVQEGERRAGPATGLPPGYTIKSMTYGPVDLLSAPMKVTTSDTAELRITVSTANPSPVKVSGKVTGVEATMFSRGPVNVSMTAPGYVTTFQANVAPDGSFQFPEVFPGNYSARVTGLGIAAPLPTTIPVSKTDVVNIEIVLPGQREITGRVVVEGSAPIPRFNFRPNQNALPTALTQGSSLAMQLLNIAPAPNGTFRLTLPEGERPLGDISGLPPGYTLKTATYGTTDLMRDPLKISKSDTAELVFTLLASSLKPVSVSGKVEGLEATALTQGIARVLLASPFYAVTMNTPVRPDSSFEFPAVFPGTYVAQVSSPSLINGSLANPATTPTVQAAPGGLPAAGLTLQIAAAGAVGTPVTVADSDIRNLNLSMPRQYPISGHVEIEGGGPIPRFALTFSAQVPGAAFGGGAGFGTATGVMFNPQPDGTFRFTLPEGERFVGAGQLPPGYAFKSMAYGNVDLRLTPLRVHANEPTSQLKVTLEKTQATPWVRVSGKVTGLPADVRNVRVGLAGMFIAPRDMPLNADGTFAFDQVFQGPGSVRLIGNVGETLQPPVNITVGPKDVTDIEIVYRR